MNSKHNCTDEARRNEDEMLSYRKVDVVRHEQRSKVSELDAVTKMKRFDWMSQTKSQVCSRRDRWGGMVDLHGTVNPMRRTK